VRLRRRPASVVDAGVDDDVRVIVGNLVDNHGGNRSWRHRQYAAAPHGRLRYRWGPVCDDYPASRSRIANASSRGLQPEAAQRTGARQGHRPGAGGAYRVLEERADRGDRLELRESHVEVGLEGAAAGVGGGAAGRTQSGRRDMKTSDTSGCPVRTGSTRTSRSPLCSARSCATGPGSSVIAEAHLGQGPAPVRDGQPAGPQLSLDLGMIAQRAFEPP
jgi:hypothetical protein